MVYGESPVQDMSDREAIAKVFAVIVLDTIVLDSEMDAKGIFKLIEIPNTYLVHLQFKMAYKGRQNITNIKAVLHMKDNIDERVSTINIFLTGTN